jgi:hypothetical protein
MNGVQILLSPILMEINYFYFTSKQLHISMNELELLPIAKSLFYYLLTFLHRYKFEYSKTCLNSTSWGPAFVFPIDRCSAYTG